MHPTTITTPTVYTYTATVTNTYGCTSSATATVTVNPAVASITGAATVCNGYCIPLSSTSGGGTWSSATPAVGTIGATTGVFCGVATGTATVIYTVAGCSSVATVTVTPTPSAISGTLIACLGIYYLIVQQFTGRNVEQQQCLHSLRYERWVVTGNALGTATITYDMAVVVSAQPSLRSIHTLQPLRAHRVFVSERARRGAAPLQVVCGRAATLLLPLLCHHRFCMWYVSGTATISYRVAGCSVTMGGYRSERSSAHRRSYERLCGLNNNTNECVHRRYMDEQQYGHSHGRPHHRCSYSVAPGTATITYALTAGCLSTVVVTVTPAPSAIVGTLSVCEGQTRTLTHPTPGGVWSSSNPAIASVGAGTGIVTGVSATPAPGTAVITYTLPSGCFTTSVFTVNPTPSVITGTMALCQGTTTTLSSATTGGTWSSGSTGTATVGVGTGVVTGVGPGTATITYTSALGCYTTAVVTINTLPAPIGGAPRYAAASAPHSRTPHRAARGAAPQRQ